MLTNTLLIVFICKEFALMKTFPIISLSQGPHSRSLCEQSWFPIFRSISLKNKDPLYPEIKTPLIYGAKELSLERLA